MGITEVVEKTQEELRKEIDELHRQQREITLRLRDPRGLRRGSFSGAGPRNAAADGARPRGPVRPADRPDEEDQRPAKRRLLSAVVKVEEGEIAEEAEMNQDLEKKVVAERDGALQDQREVSDLQGGRTRRDINRRPGKDFEAPAVEHVPRILPKNEDPSLVNRNKRMLGQLLGTLEKFRKEDMKLSGTEAFLRRSNTLQRAEQRAHEESEKLRQQEREQIAERRKQDLTLRARLAAKAEEKKLELLFIQWTEHQKKLCNFIRTKTKPPIYYLPTKPLVEDTAVTEKIREETFHEWKVKRRQELADYQKQIGDQYIANVEKQLENRQNARKARKGEENLLNLQETMDKELDTHRLEHGPKTRKIPGGGNNEDEDVEDINVGEDDMIDDVLGVETAKVEAGNTSPQPDQQ